MDICRKCGGIWVDDGELEAIANYVRTEQEQWDANVGRKRDEVLAVAEMAAASAASHERSGKTRSAAKFLMQRVHGWGSRSD